MAEEGRRDNNRDVVRGMEVETTEGDLGEQDVSPAKVEAVEKDQQGHVQEIEVEKGKIFRKKLDVPADRIQAVEPASDVSEEKSGKVILDVKEEELEALTS